MAVRGQPEEAARNWSAWQAARVEVEQAKEAAEAAEHPVEEKVVEAIVEKTEIDQNPD